MEKMDIGNLDEQSAATSVRAKKRPGKASKQKSNDAFRLRVGSKIHAQNREIRLRRLGVFDESCAELEKSLAQLAPTLQRKATPLPVATRGVGFVSVAEYGRMATTWNLPAINDICTIHQYYRVTLYLTYFKMYQSRYSQNEMLIYPIGIPLSMPEELRQVIVTVTQVPITTANLLAAIGRIEGSTIYHSLPATVDSAVAEQAATYIYPTNLRVILDMLSDVETPSEWRREFVARNSIPGLRLTPLEDGSFTAANADDVLPAEYTCAELQRDVYAYGNLLSRVSGRLPKSFISSVSWDGSGSLSGTTSFDPLPTRLAARFSGGPQVPRPVAGMRRTRRMDGCPEATTGSTPPDFVYEGDDHEGSPTVTEVWSPDEKVNEMDLILGTSSYVGERAVWQTRLQVNGRLFTHLSFLGLKVVVRLLLSHNMCHPHLLVV